MHKVYELRSGSKVEYVGYTTNTLSNRLYDHVKRSGGFPNRKDLTIHEVSNWPTKKEALTEELRLKAYYQMDVTETYTVAYQEANRISKLKCKQKALDQQ
jgi:predicted GIY-YIG superfamily endonuclease